jgi:hypothetical protein
MTDNVGTRVLRLFRTRLRNHREVSSETVEVLCDGSADSDFGDDDEVLQAIVNGGRDDG